MQFQADPDRFVDLAHQPAVHMADKFPQTLFVDGPDLFQQNHRIFYDMVSLGADLNVRRQLCLIHPGRDRRTDHRRAVPVAYVVLYHQYRTDSSLFRAHHRA